MSGYYYLMASQPYISFDSEVFPEPLAFLAQCGEWMTDSDLAAIRAVVIGDRSEQPTKAEISARAENRAVASWNRFEAGIRNVLVQTRAENVSRDGWRYIRRDDSDEQILPEHSILELVKTAAGHDSPLRSELDLLRIRWAFIEELIVGHYFDVTAAIAYAVKLVILERKAVFDTDRGAERFHAAYVAVRSPDNTAARSAAIEKNEPHESTPESDMWSRE